MVQTLDSVTLACRQISRQVRDCFGALSIHFVVYRTGQRVESLGLSVQDILYHPAAESAIQILGEAKHNETAFLGLAVAKKNLFLGLANRQEYLGICCINADQYNSIKEVRRRLHYLVWHCIDAMRHYERCREESGFFPESLFHDRTAREISGINMCADVFSVVMSQMEGDYDSLKEIALMRSGDVLKAIPAYQSEYYPFPFASESAAAALRRVERKSISKRRRIQVAIKVTDDVEKIFGESSIGHWLSFSEPAQQMAWRGFRAEEILSAAINTSDDTYVRTTGYLVSEITGIKPASILSIRSSYSPFADEKFNVALHEKTMRKVFEDAITASIATGGKAALVEMANRQNYELSAGRHIGWCAYALQKAADKFEELAERSGVRIAEAAASKEFEAQMVKVSWASLKAFSDQVVMKSREGAPVTLHGLLEFCMDDRAYSALRESIAMTAADANYGREQMLASGGLKSQFSSVEPGMRLSLGRDVAGEASSFSGSGKSAGAVRS